jgi:hypothetical protein
VIAPEDDKTNPKHPSLELVESLSELECPIEGYNATAIEYLTRLERAGGLNHYEECLREMKLVVNR